MRRRWRFSTRPPAQNRDRGLDADELFEKGRLLDQMGRYEEAFAAFDGGQARCAARSAASTTWPTDARQLAERLRGFFTARAAADRCRAPRLREDMPQPIFILGFPRSGTTLVEQTLSAHPRIVAGDELPFINEITDADAAHAEQPAGLSRGARRTVDGRSAARGWTICATTTCSASRQLGILEPGAAWFTDKMPLNETHLGPDRADVPAARR